MTIEDYRFDREALFEIGTAVRFPRLPKGHAHIDLAFVTGAPAANAFIEVQARAENVRIDAVLLKPGPLYVRIGSEKKRTSDAAVRAWLVEDGHYVAYSGMDGAGGYENEGQSLRIYDTVNGSSTKVLSEYYTLVRVTGVRTTSKKLALIVEM